VVTEGLTFVALGELAGFRVWGETAKMVQEGEGGKTNSFKVMVGGDGDHH
jgi:hypothetical protein